MLLRLPATTISRGMMFLYNGRSRRVGLAALPVVTGWTPLSKTARRLLVASLALLMTATAVLAAGETVFINATGKGNYDFAVNLDVPAGTWTLRASYTSKRAATAGKCKLWTGTAKAAAADIEVKKQRQ